VKKVLGAILIAGTTVLGGVQATQAGSATDAALGLGAFAVFNQLVRGETVFHGLFRPAPVVVQQPIFVAPPPPVVVAPPPPVVHYAPRPAVVYAPAPVYYAPRHVPPGHYKKAHPHWKKAHSHWKKAHHHWRKQYRPY
jgi:hypothetical protein